VKSPRSLNEVDNPADLGPAQDERLEGSRRREA
jgi:hypothetical protein